MNARRLALVLLLCMTSAIAGAVGKVAKCDTYVEIARSAGGCRHVASPGGTAGTSAPRSGMSPGEAAALAGGLATVGTLIRGAIAPSNPPASGPAATASPRSDPSIDDSPTEQPSKARKQPLANLDPPPQTWAVVPALVGKTVVSATRVLRQNRLDITVDRAQDGTRYGSRVVAQAIDPGQRVPVDSIISIKLNVLPPSAAAKAPARLPGTIEAMPDMNASSSGGGQVDGWFIVKLVAALLSLTASAYVIWKLLVPPPPVRCYVLMRSDIGNQSCRMSSHRIVYPSIDVRLGSTPWEAHISTMSSKATR